MAAMGGGGQAAAAGRIGAGWERAALESASTMSVTSWRTRARSATSMATYRPALARSWARRAPPAAPAVRSSSAMRPSISSRNALKIWVVPGQLRWPLSHSYRMPLRRRARTSAAASSPVGGAAWRAAAGLLWLALLDASPTRRAARRTACTLAFIPPNTKGLEDMVRSRKISNYVEDQAGCGACRTFGQHDISNKRTYGLHCKHRC